MLIKVGNFEFTEVWDGVLYKKLSNYPAISDWEVRTILAFIDYEKAHGRECLIECEDNDLLHTINEKISKREKYLNVTRPALITECTACPYRKGCVTKFVCHTTSYENAKKIFQSGMLLSACNARGLPATQLMKEKRNAANDPCDYFEYIMFAWGNCQAGDRLVMERKHGRFPNETDLSTNFTPGIRFYFKYDEIIKQEGAVFDGVLPLKIKDKLQLSDWLYAVVIPLELKEQLKDVIPSALLSRTHYIENDCKDIWDWSEKVYTAIEKLDS